jgi:phosphoribosylaminoimidazole carboxylase PurE protein
MVAAMTIVPVLGVPVPSKYLRGEDSMLSILQMPKGVPVATFAIGEAGAANAALTAVAMLAATDDAWPRSWKPSASRRRPPPRPWTCLTNMFEK